MAGNDAVTVIATESRSLRALPFRTTEDQLSTGKEWEEWLEAIEREFRYFKISSPTDKKDAIIIYGGREIARLEKSLPDPTEPTDLNEYEKLRKKLNDYFMPKRNKHHARYIFLKMKPIAGESTVTYATRLREKAQECEFGGTCDERILEHLIQTIENESLIQKCISKGWNLSQFLTEAGQIEDISLQMRDMKVPLYDNYVARVNVPYKQRPYRRPYRSDKEHIPVLCRHCGYDRKHGKLEDCPAYGKTCYRCQKLNHFASVCKADGLKKAKRVHNNEGTDRAHKTYETDTSESSDDDFISKSSAHLMRIKTLKRTTDALAIRDRQKQSQEQMAGLRQELQRHTKEMEMKFERKLTEFIVHIDKLLNTRMYDAEREERENLPINDEYESSLLCDVRRMEEENQTSDSIEQTVIPHSLIQAQRNTDQRTERYSLSGSVKEREEESEQEDSAFIEECARTPVSKRARDSDIRKKKKKRKGRQFQ